MTPRQANHETHVFPPPLERNYRVEHGRIRTRSLEAHIVDHCNLNCAECCSLSPLLPRWLADPASVAADLAAAARVLAPAVFKLVGGEPLMHPALVECLTVARRSGIAPVISVTTNGLLLGRMPQAFWEQVDSLTISIYPRPRLAPALVAEVERRARRFDVRLNWKVQDRFVRMTRETACTDAAETAGIYDGCWIRERCHLMREGVFYTCTRPAHFQTLYRQQLDFSDDGIRLHAGEGLRDELLAYLARECPLRACAHCHGGSAEMVPHRQMTRAEITAMKAVIG